MVEHRFSCFTACRNKLNEHTNIKNSHRRLSRGQDPGDVRGGHPTPHQVICGKPQAQPQSAKAAPRAHARFMQCHRHRTQRRRVHNRVNSRPHDPNPSMTSELLILSGDFTLLSWPGECIYFLKRSQNHLSSSNPDRSFTVCATELTPQIKLLRGLRNSKQLSDVSTRR